MANEKITTEMEMVVDDSSVRGLIDLIDQMGNHYDKVQKGINKSQSEGVKQFKNLQKSISEIGDSHKEMLKSFEGKGSFKQIFEQNQKGIDEMQKSIKELAKLENELKKAEASGNEKVLAKKQAAYDSFYQEVSKKQVDFLKNAQEQGKDLKKAFIDNREDLSEYLKKDLPDKLGKGIGGSIKGAIEGDAAGILNSLSGIMGGAITAGAKKFSHDRQRRASKRKHNSSMGPSMMERAGNLPVVGKGIGGITKMLGGLVKMLGPIMMAVGGVSMLVKLLIDSEAQVIELNKALTSSVSLMKLGEGNVALAKERMEALSEAATDFRTNVRLGLDPKQHYEVIGALEDHNASLTDLGDGYADFGYAATSVVTMVREASLNLATDMGTVSEFVGKLSDLHAMELPQIQEKLQHVVGAAEKASMSTKNFFSTVSQITGQMGLYNYKIEETSFILGEMSQHLDADTAKEFATAMSTGIQNMNAQERIRAGLLAGTGRVQEMLTETSREMLNNLGEMEGGFSGINTALSEFGVNAVSSGEELGAALQELRDKDGDAYGEFIAHAKGIDSVSEDQLRNLQQSAEMIESIDKGGVHVADAMRNLGGLDQMEIKTAGLEQLFGPIADIPLIYAEQVGVNEKELIALQRLSVVSEGQLSYLERAVEEGMDENEIMAWARDRGLDVRVENGQLINAETNQAIEDQHDIIKAMSDEEKDRIGQQANMQKDVAELQVEATQSVADILQYLIYDALNTIGYYTAMISTFVARLLKDDEAILKADRTMYEAERRREVQQLQDQMHQKEEELREANQNEDIDAARNIAQDIESLNETIETEKGTIEQLRLGASIETVEGSRVGSIEEQEIAETGGTTAERTAEVIDEHPVEMAVNSIIENVVAFAKYGPYASFVGPGGGTPELPEGLESEVDQKMYQGREDNRGRRARARAKERLDSRVADLMEEGVLTEAEMEDRLATIATEVSNDTILDGETTLRMARETATAIEDEKKKRETISQLRDIGYSEENANHAFNNPSSIAGPKADEARRILTDQGYLSDAQDAQILSGGFAPHLFAPGDMIIKSNEIADTVTGRSGQFVPDLFNALGAGGSGRGSSNMAMHNTFNINGGNLQEVENTILRVLEMAERKRYGES